jgi:hypothetical protein
MTIPVRVKDLTHVQDTAHPSYLLSRSAFRNAILAGKTTISDGKVARLQPSQDGIILRFRIW